MSNFLPPHGLKPVRLLYPWNFPGKNTGVGSHFLLQRIFPTQRSNPGLPNCRLSAACREACREGKPLKMGVALQSQNHPTLQTHGLQQHQTSLSLTISRSLFKLMSLDLAMPSNHLILCGPLLLPPSICPIIRVLSNESVLCIRWPKYWSFSFSIRLPPVNIQD